jgi:hypothetical protein
MRIQSKDKANFQSLYLVQGVGQVTSFMKYWRSPSQAGKLLCISVVWTQYSVGTSISFLIDVQSRLPHMELKWLQSLREYLQFVGGTIELDNPYIPKLERTHDYFIMDAILQSNKFTDKEIQWLNCCRMYLQVVTIFDITKANGSQLDPDMLKGKHARYSSRSRWHKFRQERPSEKRWQIWRTANLLWSREDGTLHQPLTRWRQVNTEQRRAWHAYGGGNGKIYIKCEENRQFSTPYNKAYLVTYIGEHQQQEWHRPHHTHASQVMPHPSMLKRRETPP